jgi:cyclic di-GMP phosphodiesterase
MPNTINRKPTIFIVDDEKINIKILADVLKDTFNISIATNGAEALKLIHEGLNPNMILLDVMMPDMDGFSVCQNLKDNVSTASIPIVFVTAMNDALNEERGLKLGAVDYIYKPINPAVVRARVALHLELQQHRAYLERILERRTNDLENAYDDAKLMREIIQEWLN